MHLKIIFTLLTLLTLTHSREIKTCPAVKACIATLSKGKRCPLLPVPKSNLPKAPVPAKGFLLEALRRGVHGYFDSRYRSLIIYRSGRLILIDFPESGHSFTPSGEYLLIPAIAQVLSGEVPKRVDMIYSHRHTDHIGGAGRVYHYLETTYPGIKIFVWGTRGVRNFLKERKITRIPPPKIIVGPAGMTINIASQLKVKLSIVGGLSYDDIAFHIALSKDGPGIMFYVGAVTPDHPPSLNFGLVPNLFRTIQVQKELLKLDWEIFVPGNGRLGTKFDIDRNLRYISSVFAAAHEAFEKAKLGRLARIDRLIRDRNAVQFGNEVLHFITGLNVFVDFCVKKTIQRWGCRLTGVDLLAPSHCAVAVLVLHTEA